MDITDKLCAGESAELVVAVDNRINHSTLPVGNEEGTSFMEQTMQECRELKLQNAGENHRIF